MAEHWTTGWLLYEKTDYEAARESFQHWLEFIRMYNPEYSARQLAYNGFCRGLIDLRSGHIDSARSRLAEIESLLPDVEPANKEWIQYRYELLYTDLLLMEDSTQKAVDLCENRSELDIPYMKAERLAPYNIPCLHDILARVYQQNGELDKAIAEYERLLNFDPAGKNRHLIHPRYHYRLARLYQDQGLTPKAIQQYETFLALWQDADEDLPELVDARQRLSKLTGRG